MADTKTSEPLREVRMPCKIRAMAHCLGGQSTATVLDLSENGFSLYLRSDIGAEVGCEISIDTEELGLLSGEISWSRLPRVGVATARSSNTAAKIASYFNAHR